jgi:hypothetical protein
MCAMTDAAASPTVRRHWLPSIPATVFIGVLAFVIFGFQEPLLNSDGDLARHLRHGEWMLQHHGLIRADPFSFSRPGQPFIAFEYGSQLAYALANRLGGLAAVTVLAALLIAAAYALLTRYMLRRGVDPLLAAITVGAAILTGMSHWLARPHLFTLLLLPVLLELLTPLIRWRLWPFPVLFAIWANFHGGFVYGLVLIGLFLAAALWDVLNHRGGSGHRARFYGAALGLAIGATLLTPHGIALYRHIVAFLHETYVLNHTGEFASPDFHDPATKLFLFVLLLVTWSGLVSGRKATAVTALIIPSWIYFALIHQRDITLFGLVALPILALHIDPLWRSLGPLRRVQSRFANAALGASTSPWVGAATAGALVLALVHGRLGASQVVGDGFSDRRMPVHAVEAARRAGLTGRLFADFGWGGYLLYAWPEQKVFIDGGADFYGSALMRDYGTIRSIRPGWRQLMDRWKFGLIMVRPEAPIATELTHEGTWRYWYCDRTAVVLVPASATVPPAGTGQPGSSACAPPATADPSSS